MAEVLGARSCILVKNVDGLFAEDPRVNPGAELIEEISVDELIRMDMEDMVLEHKMLYLLRDTVNVREIRIVNGHMRGNIGKAIRGERVGTVIRA
jgi:molybdenum storage protein